jgi:predicted metalloprotease with PDZ domain
MMPPPNLAGIDFRLDQSNHVLAVRGDAERASLRVGDKVLTIDGFDLSLATGRRGYFEHVASKSVGDPITLLIERAGAQMEITMRLPPAQ